jgi:hypothetical protein
VHKALDDAGLAVRDVDWPFRGDPVLLDAVGDACRSARDSTPKVTDSTNIGGASSSRTSATPCERSCPDNAKSR